MFKKILVCVDGSKQSVSAAQVAAGIARMFGSDVVALNVFRWNPTLVGAWALTIDQGAIDRTASDWMEEIKVPIQNLCEKLNVPVRFIQQAGFEPEVDAILCHAECEKADLIVVGSRGLNGAQELFLGSVSMGVLHHAQSPVLIVHGCVAASEIGPIHHIVLASDGSPHAQQAAAIAIQIAEKAKASLTILNAYEELSSDYSPGTGNELLSAADIADYATQWMEYIAQPIREMAKNTGVDCKFVQEDGKPSEAILNFAAKHQTDLIVLGSRGLKGYQRMLLGSVSNQVVHRAGCSVLVVR